MIAKITDDYSPIDNPNMLNIVQTTDGDIVFHIYVSEDAEDQNVRIATNGGKHSIEFILACQEFAKACNKEYLTILACKKLAEIDKQKARE